MPRSGARLAGAARYLCGVERGRPVAALLRCMLVVARASQLAGIRYCLRGNPRSVRDARLEPEQYGTAGAYRSDRCTDLRSLEGNAHASVPAPRRMGPHRSKALLRIGTRSGVNRRLAT